jgi:SPP1 gp7 family putative phage head morphogenesis protein
MEQAVERLLFPVLEAFVSGALVTEPEERTDARLPRFVLARLEAIDVNLAQIFSGLSDEMARIGRQIANKNGRDLERVVGIAIRSADPGVGAMIDGFRSSNVAKIKSLVGQELVDITRLLESFEGIQVDVLRRQIQERFNVTRSKAALLARDQTLTLNSQIARVRQTNVGITHYIWTTSGDERVRQTHRDLDGTTQRWDTPPDVGGGRTAHPGEDFQCRCTAFPVLPELA